MIVPALSTRMETNSEEPKSTLLRAMPEVRPVLPERVAWIPVTSVKELMAAAISEIEVPDAPDAAYVWHGGRQAPPDLKPLLHHLADLVLVPPGIALGLVLNVPHILLTGSLKC